MPELLSISDENDLIHGHEAKEQDDPNIIFVPGFLCGEHYTDLNEDYFSATLSPNTKQKGHHNIAERRLKELEEFIEARTIPGEPIVLVAESMGVVDVLHYTAKYPDKVKKLIFINPHGLTQTDTHLPLPDQPNPDLDDVSRYDTKKQRVPLKNRAILARQAARLTTNNAKAAFRKEPFEERMGLEGPSRRERIKQAVAKKMGGAVLYGLSDLKRVWDEIGYATFDTHLARDAMHVIQQINERKVLANEEPIKIDIIVSNEDEFGGTFDPGANFGVAKQNEKKVYDLTFLKNRWPALFGDDGKILDFVKVASFNHPDMKHESAMLSSLMKAAVEQRIDDSWLVDLRVRLSQEAERKRLQGDDVKEFDEQFFIKRHIE